MDGRSYAQNLVVLTWAATIWVQKLWQTSEKEGEMAKAPRATRKHRKKENAKNCGLQNADPMETSLALKPGNHIFKSRGWLPLFTRVRRFPSKKIYVRVRVIWKNRSKHKPPISNISNINWINRSPSWYKSSYWKGKFDSIISTGNHIQSRYACCPFKIIRI